MTIKNLKEKVMEFKGTKGVWTIENLSDSNSLFIECDGKVVGTVWNNFEKEKEANAQLIASSPILLEYAIKKAKEGCEDAKLIVATIL